MPELRYALRFVRTDGDRRAGEFIRKSPPYTQGTARLEEAKLYKDLKRAYEWAYYPQDNEIVEVEITNGKFTMTRIVESRRAGISTVV